MKGKTICKPTVKYDYSEFKHIMVGFPAMVYPLDHPSHLVSNSEIVETSKVLNIDGRTFETENTIYVGVEEGD